jgi:hypothetical protein
MGTVKALLTDTAYTIKQIPTYTRQLYVLFALLSSKYIE